MHHQNYQLNLKATVIMIDYWLPCCPCICSYIPILDSRAYIAGAHSYNDKNNRSSYVLSHA